MHTQGEGRLQIAVHPPSPGTLHANDNVTPGDVPGVDTMLRGCHSHLDTDGTHTKQYWPACMVAARTQAATCVCNRRHSNAKGFTCTGPQQIPFLLMHVGCDFLERVAE
jgi:hypothetical protein